MADVSKLRLDNVTYDIKDDNARKYLVMVNEEPVSATKMVVETGGDAIELALQEDLSLLTDRRFVIIGDSYTEGYTPDSSVSVSWPNLFKTYMNLDTADCVIAYQGGAGFIANSQGNNFITLLANVSPSNPDTITDVIVAGGYNDMNQSISDLITAINTFVTNAKAKFINARVHVAAIGWAKNGTSINTLSTLPIKYQQGAIQAGASYISGSEFCLHDYFRVFSSDGYHPNQQGQSNIAYAITNYFRGSMPETIYQYTSVGVSGSAFGWNNVSSGFATSGSNGVVEVSNKVIVAFTNSTGIDMGPANGDALYDLGTLTAGAIWGNAYDINAVNVFVRVVNSGTSYCVPATLVFKNGHLYIGVRIENGGAAISLSSVTNLTIYRFATSFNALTC